MNKSEIKVKSKDEKREKQTDNEIKKNKNWKPHTEKNQLMFNKNQMQSDNWMHDLRKSSEAKRVKSCDRDPVG